MTRALLAAVLFLAGTVPPPSLAAQTRVIRGRVVALDRSPIEGLRLRVANVGDAAVRASGEFQLEVRSDVVALEFTLLGPAGSADASRTVVYPLNGRAAVPAGDEPIVILVGEPVERAITRALAERRRLSEQLLGEYGVQAERLGSVEAGIQRVLERLDLREADLRDEIARKDRQAQAFPPIAESIRRWVDEAKDLHTALSSLSPLLERRFDKDSLVLRRLEASIDEYNEAYVALVPRRAEFEMQVEQYWQEGAAARRELVDILDNVVEQIHFQQIKPLNEQLVVVFTGVTTGDRGGAFRSAMAAIASALPALERALDQAALRADRTIAQLRPS